MKAGTLDDQILAFISSNVAEWPQMILILFLLSVGYSIFLGATKRAVFYSDYNDLALSAGTFGIPAVLIIIMTQFNLFESSIAWALTSIVFGLFLLRLCWRTWEANEGNILSTLVIIFGKLTLSLLYVFYLYQLFTGKNRQQRGSAAFIMIIFTPILFALVHTKSGAFRISSSGRPMLGR